MKTLQINLVLLDTGTAQAVTELVRDYALKITLDGIKLAFICTETAHIKTVFSDGVYEIHADSLPHFCFALSMMLLKSQTVQDNLLYTQNAREELLFTTEYFFDKNGLMLDVSRNAVANVQTVKRFIRQLAFMGHSWFMLYMEDVYEVEGEPYFGALRGRYSVADMREMDAYARLFGVELVPCIQSLAHVNQFFLWEHIEYAYKDIDDILNIGSEKVKNLLERMIATLRKGFSSKTIHIGMDEAYNLGRGHYLDDNGLKPKPQIMLEHLNFMKALCKKYGFMPIIWDDMFFMHYSNIEDNPDFKIPDGVGLMYWDYYNNTTEHYLKRFDLRAKIADNLMFAGGAWRWTGFIPHHKKTLETTIAALNACRQKGIKTVIATSWSDDGSEAPLYTCMFGAVLFAYFDYHERFHQTVFNEYLYLYTGSDFDEWMAQGEPDLFAGTTGKNTDITPSKYLLYQDPLGSKFLYYIKTICTDMDSVYEKAAQVFSRQAQSACNTHQKIIAEFYAQLMYTLRYKWRLPLDIWEAYHVNDKVRLEKIVAEKIRPLKLHLQKLAQARRRVWFDECNAFGGEILDHRFGAMLMRLEAAEEIIGSYVAGERTFIGELEEHRLDPCPKSDKIAEPQAVCYNRALRIMSAARQTW
jgi:hypothetical protein